MKWTALRTLTLTAGLGLGGVIVPAAAQWSLDVPGGWTYVREDLVLGETELVQPPIDVEPADARADAAFSADWLAGEALLGDLGTTVQLDFPPGAYMTSGGTVYRLVHIHFHTPGPRSTDSEAQPVVAHFVHATDTGELGVLGVALETGDDGAGLAPLMAALEGASADGEMFAFDIDPDDVVPAEPEFLCHMGSLAVQPCTEGKRWRLFDEAIDAQSERTPALQALMDRNAPRAQP